jgi:DNA invertase Pin-like site-specific DNA recombinase
MARKRRHAVGGDGPPRLIGLIRVSTPKQGESGLGLEGQEAALEKYRASVGGELIRTYREVESGKHDDVDSRPQFRAAVEDALYSRATLVIAKIDRLVRSIPVMGYLERSCVKFVACDNPHANKLTTDILVVVASAQAVAIGNRTREALAAYKAGEHVSRRIRAMYPDGVPPEIVEATKGRLGASLVQCRNLTEEARAKGTSAAARAKATLALAAYNHLLPTMGRLRADGLSNQAIADKLDELGHKTIGGCKWNRGQVRRVLARVKPAD